MFPVLPARRRPVLGAATRRPGDDRAVRRDVAGQHQQTRERIRPGISRAIRGQAAAARESLYWRGPVLNNFDGFTWRRERAQLLPRRAARDAGRCRSATASRSSPPISAGCSRSTPSTPVPRRDVFMSSRPAAVGRSDRITERRQLRRGFAPRDASTGARCRRSAAATRPRCRRIAIRARCALALELRARTRTTPSYARAVLDWFRDNGLEYTLEPGVTTVDSVDTTLFDSKRGFCGHFASAYAMMMRAAGVPARVVTGYLGGEWNPVGGYLIVRQSDAHAWTEIWLEGRGWTRIDPTAVVAPERLQQRHLRPARPIRCRRPAPSCDNAWFSRLDHLWDGANQWWQERVVEFNLRAQFDLLRKLGIDSPDWQHLGWAFAVGLAGVDRLGEPVAAAQRRAPEAGPHRRAPGCARRASWRAWRRRARRARRADGLRAASRRAAPRSRGRASTHSRRAMRGCVSAATPASDDIARVRTRGQAPRGVSRHAPQQARRRPRTTAPAR